MVRLGQGKEEYELEIIEHAVDSCFWSYLIPQLRERLKEKCLFVVHFTLCTHQFLWSQMKLMICMSFLYIHAVDKRNKGLKVNR